MKRILTSAQMKACDQYTSEHFGVPSIVLMERAAVSVGDAMVAYLNLSKDKKVLVLCGTGNNGADGLALARILFENEMEVSYFVPFDNGKHSELFDIQRDILVKYGIGEIKTGQILSVADLEEYDVIVDALFGIGLTRNLSEEMCDFLLKVNDARAMRVAVDVPSGINSDTGAIMGEAFKADLTVTFGFAKIGLMMYPGRKYTGKLVLSQIGITEKSIRESNTFLYEETDVINTLKQRPDDGNKGTFGKVLIFAGSPQMAGAGILASRSAYRSGAGMVKLITHVENSADIRAAIPEVMMTAVSEDDTREALIGKISEAVKWADVVVIGPGIGFSELSMEVFISLLELSASKPLVIDADGLTLITENKKLHTYLEKRKSITVMTPHIGELARLIGKTISETKLDQIKYTSEAARLYNSYVVGKDAVTIVTDGSKHTIVASGNNGMATAGSGDVLAGMIAAFLAFETRAIADDKVIESNEKAGGDSNYIGNNALDRLEFAVRNAVYMHGMAGTECLKDIPEESIMAGDIIGKIPTVMSKIRNCQQKSLLD